MEKSLKDMSVNELIYYYESDEKLVHQVEEREEREQKNVVTQIVKPNHVLLTETIGVSLIVVSVIMQTIITFFAPDLKNLLNSENTEIVTLSATAVLINLIALSLFFLASHARKNMFGWWLAFSCLILNALIALSVYYKYVNISGLSK